MKSLADITHPELVAALVKPGQDIIDSLTPQKAHMLHMAACIPGEVCELIQGLQPFLLGNRIVLDINNLDEEGGDLEFYVEGYRQSWDLAPFNPYPPVKDTPLTEVLTNLIIQAGHLFDFVKKHVLYNKPQQPTTAQLRYKEFVWALCCFYKICGLDRDAVRKNNIAKLSKRYAGLTYSDKSAQERADKLPEPQPAHLDPNDTTTVIGGVHHQ